MCASALRYLALVSLLACGAAIAAPFASVPSVAPVGRSVTVTGGGFAPGSVVTARITGPNQSVAMAATSAGADGAIAIPIVTSSRGAHAIQLIGADGSVLVKDLRMSVTP